MITPTFVDQYIAYLQKLQRSYPTEFYSRYGISSQPSIKLTSTFDSSKGWLVIHQDQQTGKILLTECIEPANTTNTTIPPIHFNSIDNGSITPQYAPPAGFFTLVVENKNLPTGYAATTRIEVYGNGNTLPNSIIDVPFSIRLELPLIGVIDGVETPLMYKVGAGKLIDTQVGKYIGSAEFPNAATLSPIDGHYHKATISWTKQTNVYQQAPSINLSTPIKLPAKPLVDFTPTITLANSNVTQPTLYQSTVPAQPMSIGFLPPKYSVRPYVDPPNSYRATQIEQMFSFTPTNNESRKITYNVGVIPNVISTQYTIRNNTISNPLKFTFEIPEFLSINVQSTIILNPLTEIVISVSFNESNARLKSMSRQRIFEEFIKWTVEPLNLTGPIFIRRSLPTLSTANIANKTQGIDASSDVVTDVSSYNLLFASTTPSGLALKLGETRLASIDVKLDKNKLGASPKSTHFSSNSIKWFAEDPSVINVVNDNGNGSVSITGLRPGNTRLIAQVLTKPVNVSADVWTKLLSSITGSARLTSVPNIGTTVETVTPITVFSSTS